MLAGARPVFDGAGGLPIHPPAEPDRGLADPLCTYPGGGPFEDRPGLLSVASEIKPEN